MIDGLETLVIVGLSLIALSFHLTKTVLPSACMCRVSNPEDESGMCSSLVELLERESQLEEFVKGISYAMFKMAERGLVDAAKILLRYGADLHFEGE